MPGFILRPPIARDIVAQVLRAGRTSGVRFRTVHIMLVSCLALICFPSFRAQSQNLSSLQSQLTSLAKNFHGTVGVAVRDLNSGANFSIQGSTVFTQASSIKIAILAALLKQDQDARLHLTDLVPLPKNEFVGGSGILQYFDGTTERLTIHDLAVIMIVLSDNTATNLVLDRVGIDSVNAFLTQNGFSATRLNRRMMDSAAMAAGRENLSTPDEMSCLLDALYRGKLLDEAHTKLALQILAFPKVTPLSLGLPDSIPHADKPGALAGVRTDSGIVLLAGRPYVLCVMINHAANDGAAENLIAQISRATFNYFKRQY
jgi:beta-lactamase class A